MRAQNIMLVVGLVIQSGAFVIAPPAQSQEALRYQLEQRERPDDPYAAPRHDGSSTTTPVVFGAFTHIQVNLTALGANKTNDAANEPSIAVDPTNPNRIAIGWRQFDTVFTNFRQAGNAYSTDGGRTWNFHPVLQPGVFRSDPVLSFERNGTFYYNSLTVVGGNFSCQVFKSTDAGMTWGPAVEAFGGDKAWMTVDRSGGGGDGHIYSAWSVFAGCCNDTTFTRSIDDGASFSPPTYVTGTPIFGTMDVGPDGALYVGGVDPNDFGTFLVAKSTNAQLGVGGTRFDFATPIDLGGTMEFFLGVTSPNPDGLLGQAAVAADPTDSDNVYLLCSVDPTGTDPMDVHFSRSEDGGLTWTAPIRVNDDPTTNGAWQWFGTMSVAPNGRIDVVWNDTRGSALPNVSALYYAFSADNGNTWSANQQVSPTFNSHVGWPNQNKLGDYYHLLSDDVGAHLAWASTFNGEQDVWYVRIGDYDCNTNGVGDATDITLGTSPDTNANGIPDECETVQQIPTVTEWGTAVLVVLVLGLGTVLLARRRRVRDAPAGL